MRIEEERGGDDRKAQKMSGFWKSRRDRDHLSPRTDSSNNSGVGSRQRYREIPTEAEPPSADLDSPPSLSLSLVFSLSVRMNRDIKVV